MNLDPPQDPLPEIYEASIERCISQPTLKCIPHGSTEPREEVVEVVKLENAQQAYVVVPSMGEVMLDHHAPGWGSVRFGVVLPRIQDGVYRCPSPQHVERVAIKRLNKQVVNQRLNQNSTLENPYKEIARMQKIGDNKHVLKCIEALEDDRYLYIIMPYCRKSLRDFIPWQHGMPEDKARQVFLQIWENLMYLHTRGICHRDLSPDNCLVYNDRIVFTDLAMSFRMPASGIVKPLTLSGKQAFLPPEVCQGLPFEPRGCDLWAAVIMLFNMLTGDILYERPHPSDLCFRYFVMARALSNTPMNELTYEILSSEGDESRSVLFRLTQKYLSLSPEALEILGHSLRVEPHERWKTKDIQECSFLNKE